MPQILCLGEILFDCLADQLGRELNEVESWTAYPGGAPANVACGLVKLGTSAGFIGCIGQDKAGDELFTLLSEIGVDTTPIQRHTAAPTRKVYVTRSLAGERTFAGFGDIPTTEFADTRLQAEKLSEHWFQEAQYLVIGTLELAYPDSRNAIHTALELAKKQGVKVFLDINWRPVFWLNPDTAKPMIETVLPYADIIKCSDEEGDWLFGTQDPTEIIKKVKNAQGILVTAGEKGCEYHLGDYSQKLDVFKVNVVDTTGAGDSFVAGFLHCCTQAGNKIFSDAATAHQAVVYASATGALTTTQAGAIASQPSLAEVEHFLRQHDKLS